MGFTAVLALGLAADLVVAFLTTGSCASSVCKLYWGLNWNCQQKLSNLQKSFLFKKKH